MRLPGKWALLAALFVSLVVLDQWTKFLAVERLTRVFERTPHLSFAERVRGFYAYQHLEPLATEPYYVWRPVWRMNYVENPGAAWGLFRGFSEGFRNAFFTLISVGAVGPGSSKSPTANATNARRLKPESGLITHGDAIEHVTRRGGSVSLGAFTKTANRLRPENLRTDRRSEVPFLFGIHRYR